MALTEHTSNKNIDYIDDKSSESLLNQKKDKAPVNHTVEHIGHNDHQENIPFFKTDIVLGISVWVVFFLLLIVLYLVAWKPILAILDAREKKISDSLAKANEIEQKLININEQNHQILLDAKEEANQLIENAQKEAIKVADDIKNNSRKEADKMLQLATEKIEVEKQKVLKEIEKHSIDLALQMANKILNNKITLEDSLEFANKQLEK